MGRFSQSIARLKRPVDYCLGDYGDPDGCRCGENPKQRERAAKQRADFDAAATLLEAADKVDKKQAIADLQGVPMPIALLNLIDSLPDQPGDHK